MGLKSRLSSDEDSLFTVLLVKGWGFLTDSAFKIVAQMIL